MALDVVFLAILGVISGIITGIIPGWHPNTLATLLVSLSPVLMGFFSPLAVAVCIITTAITHTFLSFIPSVYLGAPDESSTVLSVLPGHKFLLKGRGYEAVYLTVIGGVGVILFSLLFFPFLFFTLPLFYKNIKNYIAFLIFSIFLMMILSEKGKKKLLGVLIFLFSGILGIITLNFPLSGSNVLFPLFTGLFGMPTLIISFLSNFKMPQQKLESVVVSTKTSIKGIIKGLFSGLVLAILPGIGSAQAAVLVHQLTKEKDVKEFLISLGAINTVAALFSLLALYFIGKPRSGVAVVVEKILGTITFSNLLLFLAATVFATGLAAIITIKMTKAFSSFIRKFDYKKISLIIIVFLIVMVIVFNGLYGLLLLFTSTSIGMLPPLLGIKRTFGMGVLMLPIMLFYFGINFYLF